MSYSVPSVKVWLPGEVSPGDASSSTDGTTSHTEAQVLLTEPTTVASALPSIDANPKTPAQVSQKISALAEPPSTASTCRLLEGRSASLSAADTNDLAFVSGERLMVSGQRSLSLCTERLHGSLLAMLVPALPVADQLSAVHRLLADEANCQHERAARGQQHLTSKNRFAGVNDTTENQESDDSESQLLDPEDLAVLRRSSAVSLFSQMVIDTDTLSVGVGERRESLFVVKDGVDELRYTTAALQPDRLTFTQQLAFPTLAAGTPSGHYGRHAQYDRCYNDAERRMNCFAKFITVLVLALVAAFFVLFVYRSIR